MIGITSMGAYIPYPRLSRDMIAKALGRGSLKGERSVANNDEDTITMSVEATLNCMRASDQVNVDGVYFASTSAPYLEKSSAGMVATACDLSDQIVTLDFANSLRAGTGALRAALDAVIAGSVKNIVVTAAECRLGYPRSNEEQIFGDGAAAIAVGSDKVVAEFVDFYSVNNEIVDVWRNYNDKFVRSGEGRFILDEGYMPSMKSAIAGILKKTGLKPGDFKKIVLTTPDMKSYQTIAKKTGFDVVTQTQDALMSQVGSTGTAQPLMLLVAALEEAEPGDLILVAAYGNGADAFVFRATEEISKLKPKTIKKQLDNKMLLPTYEKYLTYRGILELQPGEPFRLFPSNSAYWRDQKSILRFHGSQCTKCGATIFPIQRVCYSCRAQDEFVEIACAGKTAKMFTYTIDNLAGRSDDPVIVQSVVDADDGTRFYLLMTDCANTADVKIGMEVEFTFRKIWEGGNFNNYYWKCRPVRD